MIQGMQYVSKIRRALFFIFILALLSGLFIYSMWGDRIPIEEIKVYLQGAPWAGVIFTCFYALLSIFFPTTPTMAIAGVFFGFKLGLLYTTIGGFLSAIIIFLLARILGRVFVDNLLEHKKSLELLEKYDEKIAKRGILTVAILRITPIMPFNVLSLLMGISKVKFRDYVVGNLLGLLPSNILTVYFGSLVLTEAFREISLYFSILMFLGLILWVLVEGRREAEV